MIEVKESVLEISPRPTSIKHNFPVVNREVIHFDEDVPRYVVYSASASYTWEVVDRGAFDAKGKACYRSTFNSKADWSPSDIYGFLKYLNSRQ